MILSAARFSRFLISAIAILQLIAYSNSTELEKKDANKDLKPTIKDIIIDPIPVLEIFSGLGLFKGSQNHDSFLNMCHIKQSN